MLRPDHTVLLAAFLLAPACGSGEASTPDTDSGTSGADSAMGLPDGGTCTDPGPGCTCVDSTTGGGQLECFEAFEGSSAPIPESVREQMTDRSWHADLACPDFDSLALLRMTHWGFDGLIRHGEMVVAQSAAAEVLEAFGDIYDARFPIERMVLIHTYDGDDDASMDANNTSAFNCREITGGGALSQHSYGTAIDVNPVQNPYVNGETVLPPAGQAYLDRDDIRPGLIAAQGPVTKAFDDIGWGWGGDWVSLKDYQHFSESGQ